jgi:hypothetical protein
MIYNSLPYGKAYVYLGMFGSLSYLLQASNLEVLELADLKASLSQIIYEPTDYVIIYEKGLPLTLKVHPLLRIWVTFSYKFSKDEIKKIAQVYDSETYTLVQALPREKLATPQLTSLRHRIATEIPGGELILTTLKGIKSPYTYEETLEAILEDKFPNLSFLNATEGEVGTKLKALVNSPSLKIVRQICEDTPLETLNNIFHPPFRGFYQLLISDKELTHSIFFWYQTYSYLYQTKWNLNIRVFVKIFLTWVLIASTQLREGLNKGLTSFKSGKTLYFLNPSSEAIALLMSLGGNDLY